MNPTTTATIYINWWTLLEQHVDDLLKSTVLTTQAGGFGRKMANEVEQKCPCE